MSNPEDITDPTTAMKMALALMAKAFKLNYSTPTNNNQRISSNPKNRPFAQPGQNARNPDGYNDVIGNQVIQNAVQNLRVQNAGNQNGFIGVQGNGNQNQIGNGNLMKARAEGNAAGQNGNQIRCYNYRGVGHYARNCTVRPRRKDAAYLQTQLLIAQKEEAGIQLQAEEYDLMAAAVDLDEIKEVNANCILMTNLQQASSLGTQTDSALIYDTDESTEDTSENTKFAKQPIMENLPKIGATNALSKPVTSNSVSTPQKSKAVNNDKVIASGMFRIDPSKTSKDEKHVPNIVSASNKIKPITVSQPPVITKKYVNSDLNGLSSTGVDNTKTRRPQPRSDTKHDRVPSASKSSRSKNKKAEVEEHHKNLLLFKNNKHISSACNNIQIDSQDVISKVVYATYTKCLISIHHDKCLRNYVNGKNSRGKKQKAKVSFKENQMKYQPKVTKPKKVESHKSLATPKPRKFRLLLRWSPTGKLFDKEGKIVDSSKSKSQFDCSNGDNACTSNSLEPKIKRFPNSTSLLDRNDHVAAILGFGQFCDSDLEVAFRRDACFIRNLEGVDLLKGDCSTNLYIINLYEMASASPICLMARASSTNSWLWHQRLSHLNFDTINDLARNDLVACLLKFKYHKEHLCRSCEQGKSKRASHQPKLVPNSRQRLHLLLMDLCGPMRIASINGKRYVLVIMDNYSRYTWVHFLRSKDEASAVIITFLKRITVLLQSLEMDTQETNKNQEKNDKTKHKVEKIEKDKVNQSRKSKVKARGQQKSTLKSQSQPRQKMKQKKEENIT
nr:hypothetical protein [Tanacetum cinerariifolium]